MGALRCTLEHTARCDIDLITPAELDKLAAKMPPRLRASVIMAAWLGLPGGVRPANSAETI